MDTAPPPPSRANKPSAAATDAAPPPPRPDKTTTTTTDALPPPRPNKSAVLGTPAPSDDIYDVVEDPEAPAGDVYDVVDAPDIADHVVEAAESSKESYEPLYVTKPTRRVAPSGSSAPYYESPATLLESNPDYEEEEYEVGKCF